MNYKINGKNIRIPDSEIEKSIKILSISQEEAIQMWLEDEGYLENVEQEELEKRGKENRILATIHQAHSTKERKKVERPPKEDVTKEKIIAELAETVNDLCGNAEITNKTKLISFTFEGEQYEINLIRKRKPKK